MKFFIVAVFAVGCAVPAPGLPRPRMPPAMQAEREAVLEGTLEVLIEDSDRGSRTLYFLITGDRRVPLRFLTAPTDLTTGARVRVRGRWEKDDTLVVTAIERI